MADTVALIAHLSATAEVPPNGSNARGEAHFTFDTGTKQLNYFLTYGGLSATAVDIHGPASSSSNAAVVVVFPIPESPISGTATLTNDQAGALLSGRLYVDVHTGTYAAGEIRGQIQKQ